LLLQPKLLPQQPNILLLEQNIFVIPILTNDFVNITKPFFAYMALPKHALAFKSTNVPVPLIIYQRGLTKLFLSQIHCKYRVSEGYLGSQLRFQHWSTLSARQRFQRGAPPF